MGIILTEKPDKIEFRKEALEHLTSPEQLDQLLQVVPFRSWLVLSALYLILGAAVLWAFFGTINEEVSANGILLSGGGDIYNAVVNKGPSYIVKFLVRAGDKVVAGQALAVLKRPDLSEQLNLAQVYLRELENNYKDLSGLANKEISARQAQLAQQRSDIQQGIAADLKQMQQAQTLITMYQNAANKSPENKQKLEQTLHEYYNDKSNWSAHNQALVQLNISLSDFSDQWQMRLKTLELRIANQKEKITELKSQLALITSITSPVDGTVINVQGSLGDMVDSGTVIMTIANNGQGLDALVYAHAVNAKQVNLGMRTLVSPKNIPKEEFGSIEGKVISVAEFPTTRDAMLSSLHNPELVKMFSVQGPLIAVRVKLIPDPKTASHLKWTSVVGPDQTITPGTLVSARIIVQQQAPITILIPGLRKLFGR